MTSRLPLLLLLIGPAYGHDLENAALPPHPSEATGKPVSVRFSSALESRYFLEGRDMLDGDSILTQTLELQWQSLAFGMWYGNSTQQRYDELQLSLQWHQQITETLEGYLGYTQIRFPHGEGRHDSEIHGGVAWAGGPFGIECALDAYHSIEADGTFAELSASREWNLTGELSTSLTAILGCNQGYVSDGHDGANHVAASWGISYALSESLSIGGHATYSWAIDRDAGAVGDASLKDLFHVGIGLEWSF